MNAAGNGLATPKEALLSGFGIYALDIATQNDDDIFPGTIWVNTLFHGIWVFEPDDFDGSPTNCQGSDDAQLDEDGDGFDNADELDNNTNPCSAGSLPFDNDGDLTSDLNDPDDDNDGIDDSTDPFALDAKNGMETRLPVNFYWDNGDPDPGGILSLGFTGLMKNGANYASLYDGDQIVAGGAAGIVTLIDAPTGDAYAATNTQEYGFQFGVNVAGESEPFTIHTRLKTPFKNKAVQDSTTMGIFFGTGDQDNYLKLVATANGGVGGVQIVLEQGGVVQEEILFGPEAGVQILNAEDLDLMLHINAMSKQVTASISINQGSRQALDATITLPDGWFTGTTAPATGLIATSSASTSFPVSWDFLTVTTTPSSGPTILFLPMVAKTENAVGIVSVNSSNVLAPNIAPIANAGADLVIVDADGDGEQSVKLDGNGSIDPDGTVISYTWSSNTGIEIPNGDYPVVALPTGVHTITLTVADDENETDTDEVVVTVLTASESLILYRVNAGGVVVQPTDGSRVSWTSDPFQSPSIYLAPGPNLRTYYTSTVIDMSDSSLAGTTITPEMFQIERYAISENLPGVQMEWDFPLADQVEVKIRIYLAEIWFAEPAKRSFSIAFEGRVPASFSEIKMFEQFGANTAVVLEHMLPVIDGNLDIDFIGIVENPAVKAIEIIKMGDFEVGSNRLYLPIVEK